MHDALSSASELKNNPDNDSCCNRGTASWILLLLSTSLGAGFIWLGYLKLTGNDTVQSANSQSATANAHFLCDALGYEFDQYNCFKNTSSFFYNITRDRPTRNEQCQEKCDNWTHPVSNNDLLLYILSPVLLLFCFAANKAKKEYRKKNAEKNAEDSKDVQEVRDARLVMDPI